MSSSPIRVLFLDHTAALGGAELAMVNLISHLDSDKVQAITALMEEGPLTDRLKSISDLHIIPLSRAILRARKDDLGSLRSTLSLGKMVDLVKYIIRLKRFLEEHQIEVVHTNSLKAAVLGGIAGRLKGCEVVWHVRNRISEDYLPRNVVILYRWMAHILPTFIIANSQATLDTLMLPEDLKPTAIVASGSVDTPLEPSPLPVHEHEGRQVVGLVGRICPWKGQHVFLRCAAALRERFPDARYKIVGAALFGEQAYEASLHELAYALGITDIVEFTGHRNDIPALMRGLDIVVHASTVGEPLGQVIIEGMAAGRPVVATRGGGVLEIVDDQYTGILVHMDDVEDMTAAIARLLDNTMLREQMGRAGHKRVLERFTIERTARQVEEVYKRLDIAKQLPVHTVGNAVKQA